MYYLFYAMMVIGFGACSWYSPDIKMKLIGSLLTIVNALLFWR